MITSICPTFFWPKEQFLHFKNYIKGCIIGLSFGDDPQNMYHFMLYAKWDDVGLLHKFQMAAAKLFSHPDGMITADSTDFPKKRGNSAGAARQYCGASGQKAICQASVMAGYGSIFGHCLFDFFL
ncbi:MAG: transposase [Deltaproteobacteria bacterium]|jgi:SRSO17 transposase|nr:transposase [Deltaproteobacteria bacterium]